MKLITLMRAAGRALARQACAACIERCHMVAGHHQGAPAAAAAFFDGAG